MTADRLPYYIGFGCAVVSFFLCLIGFGTGYWYVTDDDSNLFTSIGLWQACFNGYEHTSDLIGKAYYGCWWLFYKEFKYIREWLLPSWFRAVQTLMTFAVVFEFISLAMFPLSGGQGRSVRNLTITCISTAMMTCCIATSVTIFGVMIGLDRTWVPRWDMDVLGWSFGIVVVSGFFATFSCIAITTYTFMRRFDVYKEDHDGENGGAGPTIVKSKNRSFDYR